MSLGRGRTGGRERFPQEEREWGDRGIPGVTGFLLLPRAVSSLGFSKCLGTEQTSSLDLEVGPEASSEPQGLGFVGALCQEALGF